jgi:hypothetical protein
MATTKQANIRSALFTSPSLAKPLCISPGDVIGAAVMVGRIATGDIDETAKTDDGKNAAAGWCVSLN